MPTVAARMRPRCGDPSDRGRSLPRGVPVIPGPAGGIGSGAPGAEAACPPPILSVARSSAVRATLAGLPPRSTGAAVGYGAVESPFDGRAAPGGSGRRLRSGARRLPTTARVEAEQDLSEPALPAGAAPAPRSDVAPDRDRRAGRAGAGDPARRVPADLPRVCRGEKRSAAAPAGEAEPIEGQRAAQPGLRPGLGGGGSGARRPGPRRFRLSLGGGRSRPGPADGGGEVGGRRRRPGGPGRPRPPGPHRGGSGRQLR